MNNIGYALGSITAEQFLAEYWQKKPLLIKQALANFINPLSPAEIAGLACEEFAEARLISESAQLPHWHLKHGPFAEDDFLTLPESHWTLHVQGVERYFSEIYALLDHFRFIPNWRIDDVMVSYAPDQGSAGPHFDQYDVFLIQGQGNKHWKIGQHCDSSTTLLGECDLSIVEDFKTTDQWLVEPGDVLYIPPGIAHYGIAQGDSITYSVGFRAPSHAELLGEFSLYLTDSLAEDQRYQDADLQTQENPGEITDQALSRVQQILSTALSDKTQLARWFGQYMSEPKTQTMADEYEPLDGLAELFEQLGLAESLNWNEGSRVSYVEHPEGMDLFVNGELYPCEKTLKPLIQRLCQSTRISCPELAPLLQPAGAADLLLELYNEGSFYLE